MTAHTNLGQVSSTKHSSGRKLKLKNHDRWVLKRIVVRKHKTTQPQITSEINTHIQNPVSMKNYSTGVACSEHSRQTVPQHLVLVWKAMKRLQWCRAT
ncbi:transposable element Tc1 transposase [Trichonephila clavipes]|nr:transposable element Tc1 transposase [Trichonephila clavipes]